MTASPNWYERLVLPHLLDIGCGLAPFADKRQLLVPGARGRVLEVGIGTGLNLPLYERRQVHALVGVDPAGQLQAKALRRNRAAGLPLELRPGSAEAMPFASDSFDTVVCTWTLCSIPDPAAALAEMHRVLRPDGRLLLAEHGLAPDAAVARWQARLEPAWSRVAGGCHLTRDVPRLLAQAGFASQLQAGYITRPKWVGFNVWGEARKA
ncbi:methyltransferase domain-containing protein [Ramlibacter sp. AW1]|uniref:Methyltransferase domain-containing protein n=1 Tax=Ramlibacter aurantiacus TaxID=2801330 RepID=A0A936ZN64_9BURK|nr:methyltransferase domain-containing protein [Ramlibacter aurantiacus]MBL0422822.1 methyltransferase domain-containing protein [Ramlibacter aurantiacus]